jgi:hypothetical protein
LSILHVLIGILRYYFSSIFQLYKLYNNMILRIECSPTDKSYNNMIIFITSNNISSILIWLFTFLILLKAWKKNLKTINDFVLDIIQKRRIKPLENGTDYLSVLLSLVCYLRFLIVIYFLLFFLLLNYCLSLLFINNSEKYIIKILGNWRISRSCW